MGAAEGAFANVTLRQLVGSLSGMENFPPDDTEFPPFDEDDLISYRRAVALAAVESTPVLPAGTAFYYSNWDFVTAGHIIEKKTDMGRSPDDVSLRALGHSSWRQLDGIYGGPR
jgi:CubicO group peptidase (beta-lactamase class C family)